MSWRIVIPSAMVALFVALAIGGIVWKLGSRLGSASAYMSNGTTNNERPEARAPNTDDSDNPAALPTTFTPVTCAPKSLPRVEDEELDVAPASLPRLYQSCTVGDLEKCDRGSSICWRISHHILQPRPLAMRNPLYSAVLESYEKYCGQSHPRYGGLSTTFDIEACEQGSLPHCLRSNKPSLLEGCCVAGCINCCRAGIRRQQVLFPNARARIQIMEQCEERGSVSCEWPETFEDFKVEIEQRPAIPADPLDQGASTLWAEWCDTGNLQACVRVLNDLGEDAPPDQQVIAFRSASKLCSLEPLTCVVVAKRYARGTGTGKDEKKALSLLRDVLARLRANRGVPCSSQTSVKCQFSLLHETDLFQMMGEYSPGPLVASCISDHDLDSCKAVVHATNFVDAPPSLSSHRTKAYQVVKQACDRGDLSACEDDRVLSQECLAGDVDACIRDTSPSP